MNPKHVLISRLEDIRYALSGRDPIRTQTLADETELTRIIADHEVEAARLTNCAFVVKQILDAMNRVDRDEYGICVDCEEEISARRLQAVPWAMRCVHCQEVADQPTNLKVQRASLKESVRDTVAA